MKKFAKWVLFLLVLVGIGFAAITLLPLMLGTLVTITGCLVWAIVGPNILDLI